MRLVDIAIPPAAEPITLDEAKRHCAIEIDDDDELVAALISAARESVEGILSRALITQTIDLTLDGFPFGGGYFNRAVRQSPGLTNYLPTSSGRITLPRPPVQSVSWVRYLDTTGQQRTVNPSTYRLLKSSLNPGQLVTATNQIWPITYPAEGSVSIRLVCGYGDDAASVPHAIRVALKMIVSHLYNNRDAVVAGSMQELPFAVASLLAPFDPGSY
jgi:uncharacterized phiE125 gp8 family phage protein